MPHFAAIGWDAVECRVAVASLRGRQFQVEQAFSFPRTASDDSPETLAAQLAKELDARGCGRPEALVSVGRTRIELRQFTVPPAAADDLPDLVRFQAAREFNELDDRWRLDFLPIESEGEGPRTVLATAIAPAEIAAIEKVCEVAGLVLRRVLLRPCEAASLLTADSDPRSTKLLVELFAEEADLTVVSGGKTAFLRTTRFAGGRPGVQALVAEIRLTLAAARNQLGGEKIEALVLFGKDDDASLAESVKAELGIPVTLSDPFAGVALSAELARGMPAQPDRFAPLLGILQTEARGAGHPIDFLNPRRRPPPVDRRKLWVALAAAAVVLLLAFIVWSRVSHLMLAAEVDGMKAEITRKENLLKDDKHTHDRLEAAEIRKWADMDRDWLEEFDGLARGLPPAQEVRLSELTASSGPHGSELVFSGWTRTSETIAAMEEGVRQTVGNMRTGENKLVNPAAQYPWSFSNATVQVDSASAQDPAKTATAAKGAAPSASGGGRTGDARTAGEKTNNPVKPSATGAKS